MDNKSLILVAVVWFLFNLFGRRKSPPARPTGQPRPTPSSPRPLPRPVKIDATQREGSQLELLLRQLGRTLEQAGRPAGQVPTRSIEVKPVVRNPTPNASQGLQPADQDTDAEQLVARRIAAGEKRSGALTEADHLAFEQRIRQEPADKTATAARDPRRLRNAVIWREILGPPVSLRDSVDP